MSLFNFEPSRSMVRVWNKPQQDAVRHWEVWTRRAGHSDWRLDSTFDNYDDALGACNDSRKTFFNLSMQIVSLDTVNG